MKRLALVLLALGFVYAGCDSSTEDKKEDTKPQPTDTVEEDGNVEPGDVVAEDVSKDETPEPDKVDEDNNVEPTCADKCGDAECGMIDDCDCGKCAGNDVCEDNVCVCKPACDGKECGADGCGGVCGECTGEMVCGGDGKCAGKGDCTTRTYGDKVAKVNYLAIGAGGQAGEALDIDDDPDTCAPEANCADGLNNQLSDLVGSLSSFFNAQEELDKVIANGDVMLLAEMKNVTNDGTAFELNFYLGKNKDPKETCDFNAATCDYYVDAMSLDQVTCEPLIQFANATLNGDALKAGGKDNLFNLSIPIQEGVMVTVTLNMAQIVGKVTLDPVAVTEGLIGGALRKDKLFETIDALPPELLAELPVGIDMVKNMLDTFIVPDVDTDADDEADAASIGVKFTAIQGNILGLAPEAAE